MAGWRFAIDRGGTFTDLLAAAPDGRLQRLKLLSQSPGHYDDAVLEGMARAMHWPADRPLHEAPIDSVRLGTTVATNALLERRGARVGLLLTEGLEDLLLIGDQSRAELFSLRQPQQHPLQSAVTGVRGRFDAQGVELTRLDLDALRPTLRDWLDHGIESLAISLLHAWRNPAHELALAELALELGFRQISVGHRLSSATRYLDRSATALIDAYLSPVLRRYTARLEAAIGPGRLLLMRSDGALVPAAELGGAAAVLSGPAGGVAACRALAESAQSQGTLIGFDMGGTSTDVCVIRAGQAARSCREVAGLPLGLPMLEVHTVAAGGGSIIDFVDGQLVVGPASAGADPGPACYGRGGPATITDANLLLGRLLPEAVAPVFGPAANAMLDRSASERVLAALAQQMRDADGQAYSAERVALGALALADQGMAQAVHGLTTARGLDPSKAVLNGFGGAAAQHLCGVAEQLGVRELLLHPYAGVLSAWGIGLSAAGEYLELPVERVLDRGLLRNLQQQRGAWLLQQQSREILPAALRLRLDGGGELDFLLPWSGGEDAAELEALRMAFAAAFAAHFGHAPPASALIVAALVLESREGQGDWPVQAGEAAAAGLPERARWHDGCQWQTLPVHAAAPSVRAIDGPALWVQSLTTLYVAPGWRLSQDEAGLLRLSHQGVAAVRPSEAAGGHIADPVRLSLYHHRFMHLAEQMGEVLQRSARSVNIRERLDYSCALFDPAGQLIANAPHMPVHLGSMGESVRAVLNSAGGTLAAGESWILNDPYRGGTHLPDITVVSACTDADGQLRALLASRAHHADVGGISPGSMPAGSRCIAEEGVLIPPTRIVEGGELDRIRLRQLFEAGDWPARDPDLNVGEVEAQLAANRRGAQLYLRLLDEHGGAEVQAYLAHVLDHTEGLLRSRLRQLHGGQVTLRNDQGAQVAVQVSIDAEQGEVTVDFNGSSAQLADNYNAPAAVVRAAVLYVLRCLLDHPVPLNEGFARPLTLRLPESSLLSPTPPAAVVAGNVETSQLITDALLLAFGVQAGSQGTMNNLSFGTAQWQYYETIAGGAGAGPGFAGCSGRQTHVTNSRITDAEVLERRFPLRLEHFGLRRGSGGRGRYAGGDGVIRRIRFLEAVSLSVLAGRRMTAPPGLAGGEAGQRGESRLQLPGAEPQTLAYAEQRSVPADSVVEIRTPGGGGYGDVG
ncbi:MAG: hydantoinase B/oxoprolinase family protein [Xanthomonadales bacterium]|nr:hydantoinase B/oxoprolinase family protein [Xanthomonadales bacterium]